MWGGDPQAAAPLDLRLNDILSPDACRDLRTHTRITRAQPRRTKSGSRASKLVPGRWSEWWLVVGGWRLVMEDGICKSDTHFCCLGFMPATVLETGQNKNVECTCFLTHCPTPHPPGQADDWGVPFIGHSEWAPSILVPTCHMQ